MTGRIAAATLSSAALALVLAGCTSMYEIPIETPIQPKMDVTPFQRVLIAGFIAGGSDDVDANLETVRLLRSQLRSKSPLRVIEADVLPLVEVAREQGQDTGSAGTQTEKPAETATNGNTAQGGAKPAGAAPAGAARPADHAELAREPHADERLRVARVIAAHPRRVLTDDLALRRAQRDRKRQRARP